MFVRAAKRCVSGSFAYLSRYNWLVGGGQVELAAVFYSANGGAQLGIMMRRYCGADNKSEKRFLQAHFAMLTRSCDLDSDLNLRRFYTDNISTIAYVGRRRVYISFTVFKYE